MNDIDTNAFIKAFTDKITQITTDIIIKEITINQLRSRLDSINSAIEQVNNEKIEKIRKKNNSMIELEQSESNKNE